MKKFLSSIPRILFPLCIFLSANKKINKRISAIKKEEFNDNLKYIKNYQEYTFDEISPFYEKTIETKKTLEDKAKISVIGISLSITIVVVLLSILLDLKININELKISNIILIVLCMIVIIYINISGILALLVIGNRSGVYQLSPEDSQLDLEKRAEYLAICTEQNTNLNLIRQNYVYSSFLHLIYSVVILSLLFIFVTFNFNGNNQTQIDILKLSKDVSNIVNQDSVLKHNLNIRINAFNNKLDSLKKTIEKINTSLLNSEKENKNKER